MKKKILVLKIILILILKLTKLIAMSIIILDCIK